MTSGMFSRSGRRFVVASSLQQGAGDAALLGETDIPDAARQQRLFKEFGSSIGLRIDFSPAEDRVISTGYGGWVTIWNALTREKLLQLLSHDQAVAYLAISDSGITATGTAEGSIRFWDLTTVHFSQPVSMPDAARGTAITALALSPDGSALLAATENGMWKFRTASDFRATVFGRGGASAIAFSPDGEQVAIGRSDGTLEVRDWRGGGLILQTRAHDGTLQKIVYGPDSRRLVTTGRDRHVRVWDTGPPPEILGDVIAFGHTRLPVQIAAPTTPAR